MVLLSVLRLTLDWPHRRGCMKLKLLMSCMLVGILGGLHLLMNYSAQAGAHSAVLNHWPSQSKLSLSQKPHLVMFLHPGCACSKASVAELSRLLAQAPELTTQIVFMRTSKIEKLFKANSLLAQVQNLPRTKIIFDEKGIESKIFGAETSGLTHLYNAKSELIFSGGLTMARGHEGDSVGKQSILAYLNGKESVKSSLVFGCDIFGKLKTLTMVGTNVK